MEAQTHSHRAGLGLIACLKNTFVMYRSERKSLSVPQYLARRFWAAREFPCGRVWHKRTDSSPKPRKFATNSGQELLQNVDRHTEPELLAAVGKRVTRQGMMAGTPTG